jgi:hypothetical protein
MVLGILWLGGLGAILALVFGLISKGQINKSAGTESGRGMAIAGIILGAIGIVGAVIFFVVIVVAAHNVTTCDPTVSYC